MNKVNIKFFSPKFNILSPSVKKRYKGLKGGRASSKSWTVAAALVGISCTYRTFIVSAREIQKSIKESAQKLIVDTINRYGLQSQFEITNTEIRNVRTGSRFIFIGVKSNPEAIKSLEGCDICWLEEASNISEESWEILIPTIRKKGSQIWATWNPQLPTDPVEKIFNPLTNPDCVCEHINYMENPHVSDEIIKHAEKMKLEDPAKYEWIYLGGYRPQGGMNWIGLSEVMPCFGRIAPLDQSKMLVAGLDLGYSKDRSVLLIRQGNVVLDTIVWKHADPEDLADEIIGIMNNRKIEMLGIDALGPGAHMVSKLTKALPNRVIPVKYSEAARDAKTYQNLRSEAWGNIKEWLRDGCIPSGRDQEWITDLCNIKYSYDIHGRYALESKKLLISRGFPSTDCFMGESLVSTPNGYTRIDALNIGDMVTTPFGNKEIIYMHEKYSNTIRIVSDINYIDCTPDHKIFTFNRGWVNAENICVTDAIQMETNWLSKMLVRGLSSQDGSSDYKNQVDILIAEEDELINYMVNQCYTVVSTPVNMAKYLLGIISTIKMVIGKTIALIISKQLMVNSTMQIICYGYSMIYHIGKIINAYSTVSGITQKIGMVAQKAKHGIEKMVKNAHLKFTQKKKRYANVAESNSYIHDHVEQNSVHENVRMKCEVSKKQMTQLKNTEINSSVIHILARIVMRWFATHLLTDHASVSNVKHQEVKVYCPTLVDTNLFYVNGMLVSNCADALGISLVFDDNKKIVTLSSYRRTTDDSDWSGF